MEPSRLQVKWGLAIWDPVCLMLILGLLCQTQSWDNWVHYCYGSLSMLGLATFHWTLPGDEDAQLEQGFQRQQISATAFRFVPFTKRLLVFFLPSYICSLQGGQFLYRWVGHTGRQPGIWAAMKCFDAASFDSDIINEIFPFWCCGFWSIAVVHPYTGDWYLWLAPYIQSDPYKILRGSQKIHGEELI